MIDANLGRALRLLSDVWEEMRGSPYIQHQTQGLVARLPDLSLAGAQQRSAAAKALLQRMDALHEPVLPHTVQVGLCQARYRLSGIAREAEWYWTVLDPMGVGFYGMFAPSAYCGGFVLDFFIGGMQKMRFENDGDLDRYLAQLADFSVFVDQMTQRTQGQAERGMRIPKPQLPAARGFIAGFRERSRQALAVQRHRISPELVSQNFMREMQHRVHTVIAPAFDRFANVLDARYEALAPEIVGMSQYDGGAEIYAELVKSHTTTEFSPEEVHAVGLKRMAEIREEMQIIRSAVGLSDDPQGYLRRAHNDPRFSAQTTAGVASVFQRYIDRIEAVFEQAFHARVGAGHGVAPLPETLEDGMTFGYYSVPKPDDNVGRFMFNSKHLRQQPLMNIASLTYHELVPGHHLHLVGQNENDALLPVSRHSFVNAYNEGWAEYAATLAGEMGMYEVPEERYGRLIMDAFLTSRLVVDTGMNAMNWTLEQARDYMRECGALSEAEIQSETLRYSCDMPAQALAYKLGDTAMIRLRERAKDRLGPQFDLRDFHAAVLSAGALPLTDLEWHLEHSLRGRGACVG